MQATRRILVATLLAAASPLGAWAQAYPNKAVTIVVPFPPGGATDVVARLVGEKLAPRIGQPVLVVNKPGGTGAIANNFVRAQPADGYTLYMVTAPFSTAPATQPGIHNYDPAKDFTPIAQLATILPIMVASNKAPGRSVAEIVAYAKANPGKVTVATTGIGSSDHLAMAKFARMAGIELQYVPYKGAGPALQDMVAGTVDLKMDPWATAKPLIDGGQLRGLGMATLKPSALAPGVPTIAETVRGYELPSYAGLLGPAGLPPAVVDRLHAELTTIMKLPEVAEKLKTMGLEPTLTSPAEFAVYLTDHVKSQKELIKDLAIKIE